MKTTTHLTTTMTSATCTNPIGFHLTATSTTTIVTMITTTTSTAMINNSKLSASMKPQFKPHPASRRPNNNHNNHSNHYNLNSMYRAPPSMKRAPPMPARKCGLDSGKGLTAKKRGGLVGAGHRRSEMLAAL